MTPPTTPTSRTLLANPALGHQLDSRVAWLFWRDAPDGNGRQGFLASAYACDNPNCSCTVVGLDGKLIDDRLHSVTRKDQTLEFEFDVRELDQDTYFAAVEASSCRIDLDYAAGTVKGRRGTAATLQQVVPWLEAALDAELSQAIEHEVLQQKQRRAQEGLRDPWRDWQPGDLVSYGMHFPTGILPDVQWRGETWAVDDLHCIAPKCACTDVRFTFAHVARGTEAMTLAGSLVATLPQLQVSDLTTEPPVLSSHADLRELWLAFRAAHGDLVDMLMQRRGALRQLQPPPRAAVTPVAAQRVKIGRNDPCPCGSGKKAKKCCSA